MKNTKHLNILQKSKDILCKGETILYPTDTVWGIGCDATNSQAVEKIFKLKKRSSSKSLIILVSSLEMLKKYIEIIPVKALELIKTTDTPTTIIYTNPKDLAHNVIAENNTVGIRIVNDEFCSNLISKFGKPIVSTSANISGEKTPKKFFNISEDIKNGVDYIVNIKGNDKINKASKIIKIEGNNIIIIRE